MAYCRSHLRVMPSLIPSTILSLISESWRHVQKLHVCASVRNSATYLSMLSPSFCARLLNTYRSYVSLVSPIAYLLNSSIMAVKFRLLSGVRSKLLYVLTASGPMQYKNSHFIILCLFLQLGYNRVVFPSLFVYLPILCLLFGHQV